MKYLLQNINPFLIVTLLMILSPYCGLAQESNFRKAIVNESVNFKEMLKSVEASDMEYHKIYTNKKNNSFEDYDPCRESKTFIDGKRIPNYNLFGNSATMLFSIIDSKNSSYK